MRTTGQHHIDQQAPQSGLEGQRMARAQCGPTPALLAVRRRQLRAALALLYALFDAAQARANQARLAAGRPDLIACERREGERLYSARGYRLHQATGDRDTALPRTVGEHRPRP